MHLNEIRWEIERTMREYAWTQFSFFQKHGLLFANDRKALDVMDEYVEKDGWVKGHRDNYTRHMFQTVRDARQEEMDVRDARQEEMDVMIDKIYEINKPVTRRVVLRRM